MTDTQIMCWLERGNCTMLKLNGPSYDIDPPNKFPILVETDQTLRQKQSNGSNNTNCNF